MSNQKDSAKFAFFYMLSLVALGFMAYSVGAIVFQIINKTIVDVLARGVYNDFAMKFAISALIIAAPIYYWMAVLIVKNLYKGLMDKDSGVRRWLTYFIIFVTSIIMIGYAIGILYNFLDGELTTKFILKAITAIVISAITFSYYLYDIKRKEVKGKKSNVIRIYLAVSIVLIVAALVAGFIFVDSPTETRNKKHDAQVLSQLQNIDSYVNEYYYQNEDLPANIDELKSGLRYLTEEDFQDPITNEIFIYNKKTDKKFELCANFITSNLEDKEEYSRYGYFDASWRHESGHQCIERTIDEDMLKPKVEIYP